MCGERFWRVLLMSLKIFNSIIALLANALRFYALKYFVGIFVQKEERDVYKRQPEDWNEKSHEYDEIRDNMLGWDITDYGLGKFDEVGFALITLRNGNLKMDKYTKTYAEKLLMVNEGQMAPMHFHWNKMEDIINRGGGNVLITVYNSTEDGQFADTDVTVNCDGREFTVKAGTQILSLIHI